MAKFSTYGREFELPDHYTEGYTLSALEAAALNRVRGEMISHRVRSFAKEHVTEGAVSDETFAQMTDLANKADAEYVWQAPREPRVEVDPVAKEARKLAAADIKAKITASKEAFPKGLQGPKAELEEGMYPRERFEETVDKYAAHEAYIAKAKQILKVKAKEIVADTVEI